MKKGIDVSHFQGQIDWHQVAHNNIEFAYIKATDGLSWIDPFFNRNQEDALHNKIQTGAYHFFRPAFSGKAQSEFFLATIEKYQLDLPPVIDVEINSRFKLKISTKDYSTELLQFLTTVEHHCHCKPVIYTNKYFWDNNIIGDFSSYPLWLALWQKSPPTIKDLPKGFNDWLFWQYQNQGKISGISGFVDLDYWQSI